MTQYLRYLDIDDLIILSCLGDQIRYKDISAFLGLTPPALCHRIKKYKEFVPNFNIDAKAYPYKVDEATKEIFMRAKQALDILSKQEDEDIAA